MTVKRNHFLDFAKGILILLVTVGHAIQYVVYRGNNFWLDPLFKSIYMFHMPLFIGISGYLAYSGIEQTRWVAFTLSKIKTYAVPMLAWAVIYRTVIDCMAGQTALHDFPLAVCREFTGSLWFLWSLLGCLILTALVKAIHRCFWLLYIMSFGMVLFLPEKHIVVMFKSMLPYFQVGYALAAFRITKIKGVRYNILSFLSIALSMMCYSLWSKDTYVYVSGMSLSPANLSNIGLRFLAGFVASALAILLIHKVYNKTGERLRNSTSALGRDSIYVYILQGYSFIAIERLAVKFNFPETSIPLGSLIAIIVGLPTALFCVNIGRVLARNTVVAAVLFGKYKQPNGSPEAMPLLPTNAAP